MLYVADGTTFNAEEGSLLASFIQAVYNEIATVSDITIIKETIKYRLLTSCRLGLCIKIKKEEYII